MKTLQQTLILVLTAIITCFFSQIHAQENDAIEYRVTAIKKGESSIKSVSNTVEVLPTALLYIPNAFTPNGDGLNDFFQAKGQGVQDFDMKVFDRWGELIYTTNDLSKAWDGTYNGEKVQNGTYVYEVTASNNNSASFHKRGTVTLVL